MQNFSEMAKTALRIYLERGQKALRTALDSNFDELEDTLRWRKAAFHNFRAADAMAMARGQDISAAPDVQALMTEIRDIDQQLAKRLADLADEADEQIRSLSKARQKIRRYQSGRTGQPTFTHSV